MSKEFNKQERGGTQSMKAASRHSMAEPENDFSNLVRTQRKKIIFRGSALRVPLTSLHRPGRKRVVGKVY